MSTQPNHIAEIRARWASGASNWHDDEVDALLTRIDEQEAEVKRLTAELAQARAALRPFAGFGELLFDRTDPAKELTEVIGDDEIGYLEAGDFQRAVAALASGERDEPTPAQPTRRPEY